MAKAHLTEDARSKQRECSKRYRLSPKGRANIAWHHIRARVRGDYDDECQCYKGIEIRMTRQEFVAWAITAFEDWLREHPTTNDAGDAPSVDRIDPAGHYEIGNLRIISVRENAARARTVNTDAPEGTKWCPACSAFKKHADFYRSNAKSAGPLKLSIHCKACDNNRRRIALARKRIANRI